MRPPTSGMDSGSGGTEYRPCAPRQTKRDLRTARDREDWLPSKPENWQTPPDHRPDDIELFYTDVTARCREYWWRVAQTYEQLRDDNRDYLYYGIPKDVKRNVRLDARDYLVRELEGFAYHHPGVEYGN